MKLQTKVIFISTLAAALLSGMSTALAFTPQSEQAQAQDSTYQSAAGLVAAVRAATAKYQDVGQATADGYVPVLGCVSSPDDGSMGAHYLKASLLGDGVVDVAHPELLVYEPVKHGRLQLVAVEYLTLADIWDAGHTDNSPPILMGQLFDYTEMPNRFRLPAHYSLHVWAWKYNPKGVFAMWNPRVSCADYVPTM
jgi:hypothetical protein